MTSLFLIVPVHCARSTAETVGLGEASRGKSETFFCCGLLTNKPTTAGEEGRLPSREMDAHGSTRSTQGVWRTVPTFFVKERVMSVSSRQESVREWGRHTGLEAVCWG